MKLIVPYSSPVNLYFDFFNSIYAICQFLTLSLTCFGVTPFQAQHIHGCRIHLGDRPISITLSRALGSLSVWQKARLAWHIIMSNESITYVPTAENVNYGYNVCEKT